MHLFPSPYNTGPRAWEGLGDAPESRFSTFVVVSALLHLLVLCSCIDWCREAAGPLFAENAVIEIDLVSIPGPKPAVSAPGSPGTQEKEAMRGPIEMPALAAQGDPPAPITEETPPPPQKPAERIEVAAPPEKKVQPPAKADTAPSLPSSTALNETTLPVANPAAAIGKASLEMARDGTRTDGTIPVKAAGSFAPVKGAASSRSVSPGERYVDENFYYVKDLITRSLTYPAVAKRMKWQGTVVVSFVVLENGEVDHIRVVTGSGHSVLDKNVITTIEQVQPFPAPPAAAEFTMPIKYTLGP